MFANVAIPVESMTNG